MAMIHYADMHDGDDWEDMPGTFCTTCLSSTGAPHADWCEDAREAKFAREQRADEIWEDFADWGRDDEG